MKKLFAIVVLALSSSCASTEVHSLSDHTYNFLLPQDVKFYQAEESVPYAYEKLAIIYTSSEIDIENPGRLMRKVCTDAAEIGANGILIVEDPALPLENSSYESQVIAIKVFYGVARR